MTIKTQEHIWATINRSFEALLTRLKASVEGVRLLAGHSHNEAFYFRAYASYSCNGITVDVSFDVRAHDDHLEVSGDIALEDGMIIKEFPSTLIFRGELHDMKLIREAESFGSWCEHSMSAIANSLIGALPDQRRPENDT